MAAESEPAPQGMPAFDKCRLDNERLRRFLDRVLTSEGDMATFVRDYYGHLDQAAPGQMSPLEEARQRGRTTVLSLILGAAGTERQRVALCRLLHRRFPNRVTANLPTIQ